MEFLDKSWRVQDASKRFSELLDASMKRGPQVVVASGEEAAVLVSMAQWRRIQEALQPSLKSLLLSDEGRAELDIPPRGRVFTRPPLNFDDD